MDFVTLEFSLFILAENNLLSSMMKLICICTFCPNRVYDMCLCVHYVCECFHVVFVYQLHLLN